MTGQVRKYHFPGQDPGDDLNAKQINLKDCDCIRRTYYTSETFTPVSFVVPAQHYCLSLTPYLQWHTAQKERSCRIFLQCAGSPSRSKSSPIGMPRPPISHWLITRSKSACDLVIGTLSNLSELPATAASWLSQCHSRISLEASRNRGQWNLEIFARRVNSAQRDSAYRSCCESATNEEVVMKSFVPEMKV